MVLDVVLVMGYSRSTKALVKLLQKKYRVIVSDIKKHENENNVEFILQHEIAQYLSQIKFVVKSPGIPYHNEEVIKIQNYNIPIYTEIEIAYQEAPNFRYIAITGTNGKTTATSLTHHILQQKKPTIVAGNIGVALSEYVSDKQEDVVLELSNFQLLGIDTFRPHIATIINLTPDHLDYMLDVEKYYISKTNIYKNQTQDDYFLLNIDDENVVKYCVNIPAKIIKFSTKVKTDVYIENNKIYYNQKEIADLKHFPLKGEHNQQNAMIAVMSAYLIGIDKQSIQQGLASFKAIKHRLQYLKTINGVEYYNDSKATNPESLEVALKSFNVANKIILLAGGYDKKVSFDILKQYNSKIKKVFAFGEVKQLFSSIFDHVALCDNLQEALQKANDIAVKGDIILLSPGCASYDQFESFEHRGDVFIELVNQIK